MIRPTITFAVVALLAALAAPAHAGWERWRPTPREPRETPRLRAFAGVGLAVPVVLPAGVESGWALDGGVELPVARAFSVVGRAGFEHMLGSPELDPAGVARPRDSATLVDAAIGGRLVVERGSLLEYLEGDVGVAWSSMLGPGVADPAGQHLTREWRPSFAAVEGVLYQSPFTPVGCFMELQLHTLAGGEPTETMGLRFGITFAREP